MATLGLSEGLLSWRTAFNPSPGASSRWTNPIPAQEHVPGAGCPSSNSANAFGAYIVVFGDLPLNKLKNFSKLKSESQIVITSRDRSTHLVSFMWDTYTRLPHQVVPVVSQNFVTMLIEKFSIKISSIKNQNSYFFKLKFFSKTKILISQNKIQFSKFKFVEVPGLVIKCHSNIPKSQL